MLTICPGCEETFEEENQIAVADFRPFGVDLVTPIETEHYRADDGRLFCCIDCYQENR
jgi:hypothetical protein